MTAADFRDIALSFPETAEQEHMSHPDFRVRGKIFATLGYPDDACGMVNLTPEQQHDVIKSEPNVFAPSKGAWGRGGSTVVKLKAAKKPLLRAVMAAAWRNAAPKGLASP
jgi:hypothetical protein